MTRQILLTDTDLDQLSASLGPSGLLAGPQVTAKYHTDQRGPGPAVPELVLRPTSTEQVAQIMALCHAAGQRVVVQGGLTGLVVGAMPSAAEVVISLDRMTAIEDVDREALTLTAQAGVALQSVQETAAQADLLYPLDLGARGSATVGGTISTNAGGNRVLRYGMTRDLVLGLEVVLADGTILSNMSGYLKNNTGYDLKQLFIGSEGTLGIVTRAKLRLFRAPRTQSVGFCDVPDFAAVVGMLGQMQQSLGADLSAFEVIWPKTFAAILSDVPGIKAPLAQGDGFAVLVEMLGSDPERDSDKFEAALATALEAGFASDAVISQSDREIDALWAIRDGMAEAMGRQRPTVSFDVSLPIAQMETLESELTRRLCEALGDVSLLIGGHLADGNLHLTAKKPGVDEQPRDLIESIVYGLVGERAGSISAEHGIGTLKRHHLGQSRSPAELAVMQALKATLDPLGLLGRGRVLPWADDTGAE